MAVGDGWESQFLAGLAQHLETNSVGTWHPDGSAYTASETGLFVRVIPPAPDRIITLSTYPVTVVAGMQDITLGVQFRIRGTTDPRVCQDIGDALFELLDSAGRQLWADIAVVDSTYRSHSSLGQDAQNRWEASHNYYAQAMRRTAHRTD